MSGLVFIRHAETDLAGTFCGHADPPLNARGRQQVEALIAQLAGERFDAVHSSDLRRAAETARALAAGFGVDCTTSAKLREIGFGRWEGLRWNEIEAVGAEYARRWVECFPSLPAPEGEPFAAFEERVLEEVDRLSALAADKRIAVVTHGGAMRVVLERRLGHTADQAWKMTRAYCAFFDDACAAVNS